MSAIHAAVLSAAVSLAASFAAPAMTVADFADVRGVAAPAGSFLRGEASRTAVENYFDYDTVITLGVLALAGGALAAFGAGAARRKAAEEAEPAWRELVMRGVQADLAQFTATFRRAA